MTVKSQYPLEKKIEICKWMEASNASYQDASYHFRMPGGTIHSWYEKYRTGKLVPKTLKLKRQVARTKRVYIQDVADFILELKVQLDTVEKKIDRILSHTTPSASKVLGGYNNAAPGFENPFPTSVAGPREVSRDITINGLEEKVEQERF